MANEDRYELTVAAVYRVGIGLADTTERIAARTRASTAIGATL
jgi:hypothetical protein